MGSYEQEKLYELEALCTQEQPPAVMASCPLHVDCRSICAAAASEDFDTAKDIYQKSVLFPEILSRLCSQPCQSSCMRNSIGGALQMRGLEEFIVGHGTEKKKRGFAPKRADHVAVVGGGISGLSTALELAKKGIKVTIFEKGNEIGGRVLEDQRLPKEEFLKEIKILDYYPIEIEFERKIDDVSGLSRDYGAVFVAWGQNKASFEIDPTTYMTNMEKIFAGLNIKSEGEYPIVQTMADSKRAAISIDRYLKKVSMTVGREQEAVFETSLYTDLAKETIQEANAVPPFTKEEAVEEAKRCIDCKCLECVKGCAFLAHYKAFPRKYVREVYNTLSIAMGTRHANKMINSCSLCGQCKVICPNGLDVGAVMKEARTIMVETNKMPQSTFEFALNDLEYSNSEEFFLVQHQSGCGDSTYAFFPGCQLSASAPEVVEKAYADLTGRLEGGVGLILGCCGIIAEWAGEQDLFEKTSSMIKKAWEDLGKPIFITACPTCHQTLKKQISDIHTIGIWDFLEEYGLPEGIEDKDGELIIHDACGARNQPDIQKSIRNIVSRTGLEINEAIFHKDQTSCCGFGGLTQFSNTEVAGAMSQACIKEKGYYLTYCMNCRDRMSKEGGKAVHLLELLYDEESGEHHQIPTYSRRRENRAQLKCRLGESIKREIKKSGPPLYYKLEIQELLEQRMILESDLQVVIEEAESSNQKLEEMSTGLLIAQKRIKNVTFWVYYRPEQDGYRIEKAYSHRMQIKEST